MRSRGGTPAVGPPLGIPGLARIADGENILAASEGAATLKAIEDPEIPEGECEEVEE